MNANTIREFAAAFQKSRILLTGIELGIFTHIDETGTSAVKLSQVLSLNLHACERLLNALASMGFLEKKDDVFFNTPEGFTFLSKKSPEYLGGLMHTNHLWNTWSHLTEVVKTGNAAHSGEINDRGNDWLAAFIRAMHDRAIKQAPPQIARIDLSGVRKLIDIGGGSGAYAMEFIRQNPEIRATVFDLPNVVPITREYIEKCEFSHNITTHAGDYTQDELPGGFDLAFLSAVIHSNPLDTNALLIRKCFGALNPGGRIVIQDWIMNDVRTQPTAGAIFAINMLVGTEAGDCFTDKEVSGMLKAAGFENITLVEFESGLSQVTAVRE